MIKNPKTSWSKRVKFDEPDECYTPEIAVKLLLPYLKKDWIIWDCAFGSGRLAQHFKNYGFKVVGNKNEDFMNGIFFRKEADCIITNPPYSKKDLFLSRAFEIGIPFAFLLPLTTLEGIKRGKMFREREGYK